MFEIVRKGEVTFGRKQSLTKTEFFRPHSLLLVDRD